jgi:hypothetical protein
MPITFSEHKPQTLDEAVEVLTRDLLPEEIEDIMQHDPAAFHHTVGRKMRNEWKLWQEDSPLALYFASAYHLTHADDMSGMILGAMFAKVRGEEFDPMEQAQIYHAHWAKYPPEG